MTFVAKAPERVPCEAYLVLSENVQCAILDVQLNIEHHGHCRFTCKRNGSAIAAEALMNKAG